VLLAVAATLGPCTAKTIGRGARKERERPDRGDRALHQRPRRPCGLIAAWFAVDAVRYATTPPGAVGEA
jgi:hypothetical protein